MRMDNERVNKMMNNRVERRCLRSSWSSVEGGTDGNRLNTRMIVFNRVIKSYWIRVGSAA